MIISKTPYRISFFGGGSDYPEWHQKNEGRVLSTTINKYLYISCRFLPNFFEHKYRIVWSKIENVKNINQINHKAIREILNYLKVKRGLEIHYDGDLPGKSGVGSSSAFTVGLLNSLYIYKNKTINKKKFDLGIKAIHIERELNKEKVGSQDQIAVAVGGFNNIYFNKQGNINIKKIELNKNFKKKLNDNLLLFSTGKYRRANEITKTYEKKLVKNYIFLEEIVHFFQTV